MLLSIELNFLIDFKNRNVGTSQTFPTVVLVLIRYRRPLHNLWPGCLFVCVLHCSPDEPPLSVSDPDGYPYDHRDKVAAKSMVTSPLLLGVYALHYNINTII